MEKDAPPSATGASWNACAVTTTVDLPGEPDFISRVPQLETTMSTRIPYLLGALFLLGSSPGATQDTSQANKARESILRVFRLPRTTTEARQRGVPDSAIHSVIDVFKRGQVPADDAQEVIEHEVEATENGQPVSNFGAFVQEQHRRGLRGRALAAAIHAEQARRGMGHKGHEGDEDEGHEHNEAGGGRSHDEHGRSDAHRDHDRSDSTKAKRKGGNRP